MPDPADSVTPAAINVMPKGSRFFQRYLGQIFGGNIRSQRWRCQCSAIQEFPSTVSALVC